MTCAACTGRVERVLRAQPGVAGATANLATRAATVTLWGQVDASALAAAVSRAGFQAAPMAESGAKDPKAEEAALWRETAIAGALTLPVFVVEMGGHLVPGVHHWLHGLVGTQSLWLMRLARYEQPCFLGGGGGLGLFGSGDPCAGADPGGKPCGVF
jgi:Cu+-exporting ATPase